jgi:hypothetical protein
MEQLAALDPDSLYVRTYLYGGLGNQLFQCAAGRSLAARVGARLVLDVSSYRRPDEYRRFCLDDFAIDADVMDHDSPPLPNFDRPGKSIFMPLRLWIAKHGGWRTASRISPNRRDRSRFPLFQERSFDYDARFATLTAPISLVGYWQSARYFASIAAIIRSEFRLKAEPAGENARWLEMMGHPQAVCLHFRRGDYLQTSHMHSHGLCSMAYYARAMAHIRECIGNPQFFVFSDDWAGARERFKDDDTVHVDTNGPDAAGEELRLMSACRHHIVANSSLSWWAAWLGGRAGQMVIAPDPWFTWPRPTPDLLPESWSVLARQ